VIKIYLSLILFKRLSCLKLTSTSIIYKDELYTESKEQQLLPATFLYHGGFGRLLIVWLDIRNS